MFHGLPYHIHHFCLLYNVIDIFWSAVNKKCDQKLSKKLYTILILFVEVEKKNNMTVKS